MPSADFGDPAVYLYDYSIALEFAPSLHACRHLHAATLKCENKSTVCPWVVRQARDCTTKPKWEHAALLDKISAAPPKTLLLMNRCRYPQHFASTTSAEIFEKRRIICLRRMELNNWELIPSRKPPFALHGRLHLLGIRGAEY